MMAPNIVNNIVDNFVIEAGIERLINGDFTPKNPMDKTSTTTPAPATKSDSIFDDDSRLSTSYDGY
jgi:hypothetical protein